MQYRTEQQGAQWLVLATGDAPADEPCTIGTYPSAEIANRVATALRAYDTQEEQDNMPPDDDDDRQREQDSGKTRSLLHQPMTKADYDRLPEEQKMALHAELLEAGAL